LRYHQERGTVVDEDQEGLLTRRRLLATGAAAAASVTLLDTNASAKTYMAAAKQAKPAARYARTGYRRKRFAPHVGAPVKLRPRGGAAVRGTLVAIEDVPNVRSLAGDQDAYSLLLRGPAAPLLPEGIIGIRNNHFGVIELYVTPVPSPLGVQDYLATINRRVPRNARRARRS
jgi:hypothetical protein